MIDNVLFNVLRIASQGLLSGPMVIWASIPSGIITGRVATADEPDRFYLEASKESPGDFDQQTLEKSKLLEGAEPQLTFFIDLLDVTIVLSSSLVFERPYARLNLEQISAWGFDSAFRPRDEH